MNVVVTGANGMLGSALCPLLREKGYTVHATDVDTSDVGVDFLDVRNFDNVKRYIEKVKPGIFLHLAAETDIERCEKEVEGAFLTNAIGTQNVAIACKEIDATMVYISTAGVFDGDKPDYTEFDEPNPINFYGKSKLEGEKIVSKLLEKYFIVRAGWMMGGGERRDKKFVAKIMKQIKEGRKRIYAVVDKFGAPTYTVDFSNNLGYLLDTNRYGLYHMVGEGSARRYDVAKKIVEYIEKDDIELIPVTSDFFSKEYFAPRPKSEMLRNCQLEQIGLNKMRHWKDALKEYLDNHWKRGLGEVLNQSKTQALEIMNKEAPAHTI